MSRLAATSKLLITAVIAMLVLALAAPANGAEKRITIKGKSARNGAVVFTSKKLRDKKVKVRRMSARVNGRVKKLTVKHRKRLTRSGVLRLKPGKRVPSPYRAGAPVAAPVLVVTIETAAPRKADKPKGKPAPGPALVPAPASSPGGPKQLSCDAPETLTPGRIPGACWRPYADDSPFNRRVPANPRLHPRSADYVNELTRYGTSPGMSTGNADTEGDWGHPTYYPSSSDPLFTVHCAEDWGPCDIEGMQIRIPDSARPAGGGDGHMAVVDAESGWEYDFWQVRNKPRGGGTITVSWAGRTRIDGDGRDSAATASGYGNLAGMIRGPELAAGRIEHALFMVYKCDSKGHVYPALKGGMPCSEKGLPTDSAFPMGTRFYLDMSNAEIDALPIPAFKKAIMRAIAEYGVYFGDTGGGKWGILTESGSTYTSFGMTDPIDDVASAAGIRAWTDGSRSLDIGDVIDWRSRLRALDPCTAQGTC